MKEDKLKLLSSFLERVTSDTKLKQSHISMCAALCQVWIVNQGENPLKISRKQLMNAARIKSKTTYHKVMKDLEESHYMRYYPTHHPSGSKLYLIMDQTKE